jgi:hypothetical protein
VAYWTRCAARLTRKRARAAVEHGQQGGRGEVEELRGAVRRPHEGVHATGGFDASARIERVGLVETRPCEIPGAFDMAGQARGVGRVEQQRRVIDAGDRGRVVD